MHARLRLRKSPGIWFILPLSAVLVFLAPILRGQELRPELRDKTRESSFFDTITLPQLPDVNKSISTQDATFIENRGQWDSHALYLARTPGLSMWVTTDGVTYDLFRVTRVSDPDREPSMRKIPDTDDAPNGTRYGHVVRMVFVGARPQTRGVGLDAQAGTHNYYVGNDQSRWATDVRRFSKVRIEQIYSGVDAYYYLDGNRPRYDLVVSAGANPDQIQMRFEGAESVNLASDGTLRIGTSMGTLEHKGLFAYQMVAGERRRVECSFAIGANGSVRFDVGSYERTQPLVIDPLVWSTLIGGAGNDIPWDLAIDVTRSVYVIGMALSNNFPTTAGAYAVSSSGSSDAFITKLPVDGESLVYSTYFGGTGGDAAYGLAVSPNGSALYVTGHTMSSNFPTKNAYQSSLRGSSDAFVAKLGADGKLVYSTYLGGSDNELGADIDTDPDGDALVAGWTESTDFPQTGTIPGSKPGLRDAFVAALAPDGGVWYSYVLGGSRFDYATALVSDARGTHVYVAGTTESNDIPHTTGNFGGTRDAFVAKIYYDGTLRYLSYLGGSDWEDATAIATDADGDAFVTGKTTSTNYPTTTGAFQTTLGGGSDAFVTAMDPGGDIWYSTYLGGGDYDSGLGISTDSAGLDVYVTGTTGSADFRVSPNAAFGALSSGSQDVFVTKLRYNGTLLYSTFLGGADLDVGTGIANDADGNAYVTGYTAAGAVAFPTTPGAFDRSHNGSNDAFVAKVNTDAGSSGLNSPSRRVTIPDLVATIVPNPIYDDIAVVTISSTKLEQVRLRVHDLLGRQVLDDVTVAGGGADNVRAKLDLALLPSGQYLVSVSSASASACAWLTVARAQ